MITFDKVTFARGKRHILNEVSFEVQYHERVAILGGSGEGKTTVLKLIVGLEAPDSGTIRIDDDVLHKKSEGQLQKIRRKLGVVFQQGALFDSLNVSENIAFPLREAGMTETGLLRKKVESLLHKVGIKHAGGLMPEELSGGMIRRVAIARALATEQTKMFLYDEPTADLDPVNAGIIRNIMVDIASAGRGFIVVTHSVPDALHTSERFMFLEKGSITIDGDKEAFQSCQKESVQNFIQQATLS
ncbi:MAG: ATP-binding cassette domain-containing protein [Chitinivibrionales bacterium]|nr:ATP-binding cassette domain-containing protein [Chitinivibrionales bacterium]